MWVYFNPNPTGERVGDCSIRAVCKALNMDWDKAYTAVALTGYVMGDMPSSNAVWGSYLRSKGFRREPMPEPLGYAYAEPPSIVDGVMIESDTEFAQAVNGLDPYLVWPVIDELMTAVQALQPKLYAATLRRLNDL